MAGDSLLPGSQNAFLLMIVARVTVGLLGVFLRLISKHSDSILTT